jgi:two-component system C4-dicarboxylate transport sensor histidine kinase DctB
MAAFARTTYERLVQIINEVKAFVRFEREEVVTQPIAVSEAVHELVEFLRYERSLPLDKLSIQIHGEPVVRANRVKLQQVLINLLKNAKDAVGERPDGQITLTVKTAGERVLIAVADNGCGISAEVAGRIWEPFFTTKGSQGTGLGLDVAKSIIEAHGGTIACDSQTGVGTTFTISLPCLEPRSDTAAAGPAPAVLAPFDTLPNIPLSPQGP